MKKPLTVSTTHFYNEIASEYDRQLSGAGDRMVRHQVAEFFKAKVPAGSIMDFGGGTGLDLPWLTECGYHVFFCEPAEKMRRQAEIASSSGAQASVIFLSGSKCDFHSWAPEGPPVNVKLNAILANFGVINYIDELPILFEKFSFCLKDNGSVVINLLHPVKYKLLTRYLKNSVRAFINGEKIKAGSRYGDIAHQTTLYSVSDIKRAAEKYFVLNQYFRLDKSDFLLLHLVKR